MTVIGIVATGAIPTFEACASPNARRWHQTLEWPPLRLLRLSTVPSLTTICNGQLLYLKGFNTIHHPSVGPPSF